MTTVAKRARTISQAPASPVTHISRAESFQRGYHNSAQAAQHEMRYHGGAYSAESMYQFIQTWLDPSQIARQRDAAKNPLPPAYHAGFVAGYLSTLFVLDPACEQTEGRV